MQKIFSSCPHDVVSDPEKWSAFIDYFKSKGILDASFLRYVGFEEFAQHFGTFCFVYAHPLHAVQLYEQHGFIPLAKYNETYDEAAVIASKIEKTPSIKGMADKKVAIVNGTPSLAAISIDLAKNWPGVEFDPIAKDDYSKVLMAVTIGEADYGVILKSVWDGMLAMKSRVNHFYTTSLNELVHVFMLKKEYAAIAAPLREAMLTMHLDPEGQKILARLKCDSLVGFGEPELVKLMASLKTNK